MFPLFRADLCTKNQKWSPKFSEGCPLNRGFPLNRCPLNRAFTVLSVFYSPERSTSVEFGFQVLPLVKRMKSTVEKIEMRIGGNCW